jgi:hypothetical protein
MQEAQMEERKNRERGSNLSEYMKHDAEIRRATNVRNALGPVEEEEETREERGRMPEKQERGRASEEEKR